MLPSQYASMTNDLVARHIPGSAASVFLSKWLGELGADLMMSMVGSESMTSSDWMLLALSSMGHDSQKKVGEAFVQRLLEKGDVHPAVAILLGLGEQNDAIEVYVSRKYFMEAILLTCLLFPTDWQRQSYIVRKWGEVAVAHGKPELAVRCFSCTSLESSEPWFSPRAQDAVYAAQQQQLLGSQLSPPLSPPASMGPNRIAAKLSALKLVTNFGDKAAPQMVSTTDEQTPIGIGVTPIAESALSPSVGTNQWLRPNHRALREPSSARTATPGAYRRKRLPSKPDTDRVPSSSLASLIVPERAPRTDNAIPQTAVDTTGRENETIPFSHRRASSSSAPKEFLLSAAIYKPSEPSKKDTLPSPAPGLFATLKQEGRSRNGSRDRKPDGLFLETKDTGVIEGPTSSLIGSASDISGVGVLSPPLTGASVKSAKARSIDQYISSLEEANYYSRMRSDSRTDSRTESRHESRTVTPRPSEQRPESRNARARSRPRDISESRGRSGVRYIRPAKRSPSSPVPMSPEDAGIYPRGKKEASTNTDDTLNDESYYRVTSPVGSMGSRTRSRTRNAGTKARSSSKVSRRADSPEGRAKPGSRTVSRNASRHAAENRGRSNTREGGSTLRSPSSPLPMSSQAQLYKDCDDENLDPEPLRPRQRSTSRRPGERGSSARREASPDRRLPRDRSISRKATPALRESSRSRRDLRELSPERIERPSSRSSNNSARSGQLSKKEPSLRNISRKELAARELEERRLSLARRPSAPVIPHPGELAFRPVLSDRSQTDLGDNPSSHVPMSVHGGSIVRSQTADPDVPRRHSPQGVNATSSNSVQIGLPATPRAMRHPKYMSADPNEREGIPAVPSIPDNLAQLSNPVEQEVTQDDLGPLLPATVYGQKVSSPPRAASAPPDQFLTQQRYTQTTSSSTQAAITAPRRSSLTSRGHNRLNTSPDVSWKRVSPPPITASIDETLHENQVVIIEQDPNAPPILAELQHLAGPPPPPPPPPVAFGHSSKSSLGVINIAIDENSGNRNQQTPVEAASPNTSGSPTLHRRGRGSVSENLGQRFRQVTDRMRSTSRSRNKSPPAEYHNPSPYESIPPPIPFPRRDAKSPSAEYHNPSPYESIPPPIPFPRRDAKSPSQESGAQFGAIPVPPPAPPASGSGGQLMEQVIPPDDAKNAQSLFVGYRSPKEIRANMPEEIRASVPKELKANMPKEIRANMPPDQLQQGVYQPVETGMI